MLSKQTDRKCEQLERKLRKSESDVNSKADEIEVLERKVKIQEQEIEEIYLVLARNRERVMCEMAESIRHRTELEESAHGSLGSRQ